MTSKDIFFMNSTTSSPINSTSPPRLQPCINLGYILKNNTEVYQNFSVIFNGWIMLFVIICGLAGNLFMIWSVHGKHHSTRRMIHYLKVLCMWDTCFLVAMLVISPLHALTHHVAASFYGTSIYMLRLSVAFPLGSAFATASKLQIVAISVERYIALQHPFATFNRRMSGVRFICVGIAIFAVLLNLLMVLEAETIECNAYSNETMYQMRQRPIIGGNSKVVRFIVDDLPKLLFVQPGPIIAVVLLTWKTLALRKFAQTTAARIFDEANQQCKGGQRRTRAARGGGGISTPILLAIFNAKFVLCTIGVAILEFDSWTFKFYHTSMWYLIMTDVCHMFVVIQSSTNWALFMQWRDVWQMLSRGTKTDRRRHFSSNSDRNSKPMFSSVEIDEIRKVWQKCWETYGAGIGTEMLGEVTERFPHLAAHFGGRNTARGEEKVLMSEMDFIDKSPRHDINHVGMSIGAFLDDVISKLVCHNGSSVALDDIRLRLRTIGESYAHSDMRIRAVEWHCVKNYFTDRLLTMETSTTTRTVDAVNKLICWLIAELKHGLLCASVARRSVSVTNRHSSTRMSREMSANACVNNRQSHTEGDKETNGFLTVV